MKLEQTITELQEKYTKLRAEGTIVEGTMTIKCVFRKEPEVIRNVGLSYLIEEDTVYLLTDDRYCCSKGAENVYNLLASAEKYPQFKGKKIVLIGETSIEEMIRDQSEQQRLEKLLEGSIQNGFSYEELKKSDDSYEFYDCGKYLSAVVHLLKKKFESPTVTVCEYARKERSDGKGTESDKSTLSDKMYVLS